MSLHVKVWLLLVFFIVSTRCTYSNTDIIEGEMGSKINQTSKEVPGWRKCAAVGEITKIWVQDCVTNPCFITLEKYYEIAINFIPGRFTDNLWYKAWYYDFEEHYQDLFDQSITGNFFPGQEYQVAYPNSIFHPDVASTRGNVRIEIYSRSSDTPEGCAIFQALVSH